MSRAGETIKKRKIVRVDIIGTEGISRLDISYVDGEFYPRSELLMLSMMFVYSLVEGTAAECRLSENTADPL